MRTPADQEENGIVRRLVIAILTVATGAMLCVSLVLNYTYFASYGQTPTKQIAFGALSVIADMWKALAPLVTFELWRHRHRRMAVLCFVVWVPCFIIAMSSALGLLASDRMALTSGRESVRLSYADATRELTTLTTARAGVRPHRSVVEIDAAIASVLARPAGRTTMGALSRDCANANRITQGCAEVFSLREERAAAQEASRLDARISELRRETERLRERGAGTSSDPLAELYAFLSRGLIAQKDVTFWLAVITAVMGELLCAFGFTVVAAYAHATRQARTHKHMSGLARLERAPARIDAPDPDTSTPIAGEVTELVMVYLSERTELAGDYHALDAGDIHSDYSDWCRGEGYVPLDEAPFFDELDQLRERPEVSGKIRKFGSRYYGIRLARNVEAQRDRAMGE